MTSLEFSIELEGVSLSYRDRFSLRKKSRTVLNNLNLKIRKGETLGIIGRNGAGKSTLLKILAGIIKPDEGRIVYDTKRIVLLSYQLGFNRLLTGRENAIHSGLLHGLSKAEIETKLPKITEFSGLDDSIDEPLSTYSAGMRSRLGFAVASQSDADIILVDEALGVGDHAFREKSTAFMKNWIRSDKTVVFVSHDENSVRNLCDRLAWLENGEIVANGGVDEILRKYYDFDHAVSCLARDLGCTESAVRRHKNSQKPIELINEIQASLQMQWRQEDEGVAQKSGGMVRIYRPTRNPQLSAVFKEACGTYVWIENATQMCRGSEQLVNGCYEEYKLLLNDIAKNIAMDAEVFRQSELHKKMTRFYRHLFEC